MTEKNLRRFRATLAEVEKESNICPECDTILVPIADRWDWSQPGAMAASLNYKYCENCKKYYVGGKQLIPGDEVDTYGC